MFNAWFLVASLIGSTALAAPESAKVQFKTPPDAKEIAAMSPGNYYRILIADEYQRVEEVVVKVRRNAANGDPADAAQSYDNLNNTLGEARKRLVGWPAYKDEDGRLRDAVIEAYKSWGTLAMRERDEAAPLAAAIPKNDAHMKSFEKIRVELDKGWSKSNEKIREIVDSFATENRLVFVGAEDGAAAANPFDAELPVKSELPDGMWVTAAIRYHNALFEQAGIMVAAMNAAASKMNTMDLEPARVEALEKVKPALAEAKSYGALGGNSGFRDAVVGYGEWMVGQLEGPLKTHAELTKTGQVTREQADQLDAISDTLNQTGAEKAAALQNARTKFMSDWHFEAYLEWQGRQKK